MKNFNQFILTLLAAGLLASCSLTEEPTSFVNRKSFYKNESQCIAALNSCYMPANAIYTANFMLVTEACTDIWYSSSTTVDACLDVTPAKPQYGKRSGRRVTRASCTATSASSASRRPTWPTG